MQIFIRWFVRGRNYARLCNCDADYWNVNMPEKKRFLSDFLSLLFFLYRVVI